MTTVEQINNRKRVLRFIETFPQFHNQAGYFCGTTACIAGTTIMFDRLGNAASLVSTFEEHGADEAQFCPEYSDFFWESDTAAQLLGLDEAQAAELFYCWNESEAVAKLRVLAAEEPEDEEVSK